MSTGCGRSRPRRASIRNRSRRMSRRRGSPASLPKEEHGYRVVPELRGVVVFTVQDVLADPPFSRLDLISCRNLLIYLRPKRRRRCCCCSISRSARAAFCCSAAPRRWAISTTGSSRSPRRSGSIGISAAAGPAKSISRSARAAARERIWPGAPAPANRAGRQPWRSHAPALLDAYAPASVLINRKDECLYYSGPTDRYLRVAAGEPSRDLLAMAREGLRQKLGAAIRQASREHAHAIVTGAQVSYGGSSSRSASRCSRCSSDGEELLLVSFLDEPEREQRSDRPAEPADDPSRIAALERELDATRKELQSAIRDLEIANEEQKAINEEAMSVNEEFQSTNEELMTSKEELQSLNEELTALNSQLQETLERQRSTSNDLQNILDSSGVATLFLDSDAQHPLFHAGGQIAVPGHRHRHRPAARRPHAARRRPRSARRRRRRARQSCAVGARDRSRWRRLVHPPHPALPHPGQPDRGGGHHLRRHLRDEGGGAGDPGGARLFRQHHRYDPPTAGRARRGAAASSPPTAPSTSISRSRPRQPSAECRWGWPALATPDIPGLRGFLDRVQAEPAPVEDYEIEIELPPLGRRLLLLNAREIRDGPRGRTQDPAGDRRHHRAQAGGRGAGGRQARGRAGQSRQVALSRRRQPRSAPAVADASACCRACWRRRSRTKSALRLVGRLDETRKRDVGHAGHASRHQPARGRDRPPRDGRFPDQCGARSAAHPVHLSRGGAVASAGASSPAASACAAIRACSSR